VFFYASLTRVFVALHCTGQQGSPSCGVSNTSKQWIIQWIIKQLVQLIRSFEKLSYSH